MNAPCPDSNEFKKLSKKFNYIPIFSKISKQDHTPVSVYRNLKSASNSFLLESVEGSKNVARFSFIGINPQEVIKTGDKEKY